MPAKTAGAAVEVEAGGNSLENRQASAPGTGRPKKSVSPKESARSNPERLHIAFTPRMMERLDYLKEHTEAASYAEVLRHAMRIYDALFQEVEDGNEIYVKDPKTGEYTACRFW